MAEVAGQMRAIDVSSTALMTIRLATGDGKMQLNMVASGDGLMRFDMRTSGTSGWMLITPNN